MPDEQGFMVPDDNELIFQSQKGDAVSFEQLVLRYDKEILSVAKMYMNNTEDAKDIYQEVFLRAYRALPKFRFESKFSTWLYRIAINVCLTHRARRSGYPQVSLDQTIENSEGQLYSLSDTLSDHGTPELHTRNSEITRHVNSAMNKLSPQQKMVFTLRHHHGYKLREIASMMNCAEGTVKRYLFTATERLREQLKHVY